jgi:murein DD-endopeptidase MepM/ murein hydrolase activator NlpD
MKTTILAVAALLVALGTSAVADIYQYVDDEGTVCFTDAPQHQKAHLIYREPRKPHERGTKTPRQLPNDRTGEQHPAKKSATSVPLSGSGSLPVSGRVTSLTGLRIDPIDGILRRHNGMDIAVPKGTPVSPVAPGTVVYSGRRSGYGNMVVVDHGGAHTVYAHHDRNTVSEGETVTERTVIAYSGSTGRSTGPHLHFEAWENDLNITERFTGTDGAPVTVARASLVHTAPFRKAVQSDGSLLFTNLPLEHP